MLTSKPPFQSSTTDEIYRRAREREYVWPTLEAGHAPISQQAKDLVSTMLVEAEKRPEPDTVVQHPFFLSGYMPVAADMTTKLRDAPPESEAFHRQQVGQPGVQLRDIGNLQTLCEECGVGPWSTTRVVHTAVWKEMAREEAAGLTPAIPLVEGIVYRPFDDWQREMKIQAGLALPSTIPLSVSSASVAAAAPPSAQGLSKIGELGVTSLRIPSGLLKAPPQSFAAQQRAQGRQGSGTVSLRSQQPTLDTLAQSTVAQRARTRKEPSKSRAQTLDDPSASAQKTKAPGSLRYRVAITKGQGLVAEKEISKPAVPPQPVSLPKQVSVFGPSDCQEAVLGTKQEAILQRLRKLQAELERALNARSMALLSAKDKTPALPHIVVKWVDYTNKFGMGYTLNDGSVGCVLRQLPVDDGEQSGMLPPAFLLIHGAERHFARKRDASYRDRHQLIPMAEPVCFYEHHGEDGLACVAVSPEEFRVPVNADGTAGRMTAGNNAYDRRKRERVMLWKKFANYMVAYGREMDGQSPKEEVPAQPPAPVLANPSEAPSDVVSFYQRFGDVGCWMFGDGHLQVSVILFPRYKGTFS
jgi:hypothetical protein